MSLSEANLRPMIKQAMRDLAPQMYQELEKSGHLESVVRDRAKAAMQTYLEMHNQAIDQTSTMQEYTSRLRKAFQLTRLAREVAIAQATEFPTEEPTISPAQEA